MEGYALRGIIEGYYGPPWSSEERRWVVERAGGLGLNLYVHAPKDDPAHRERWREPLSPAQRAELQALVAHGAEHGVRVGFALSPGLDIAYASAADRRSLQARYRELYRLGARFLVLALDDVPSRFVHVEDEEAFESLAAAHLRCLESAREAVGPEVEWAFVPVDYLGAEPSAYLETLGAELPAEVHVAWTGPTVLSPAIPAEAARRRCETLRRKLLLWDNLPAADGPMRLMLHLGPYTGRGAELAPCLAGVLLNPMQHARASFVTIGAAAPLLRDPASDPERAWERAVESLAPECTAAFRTFALAHRFSPQCPDRDPELEPRWRRLRAGLSEDRIDLPALADFEQAIRQREDVATALRRGLDAALRREIEPWIESHALETAQLAAAAEAVGAIGRGESASDRVRALMMLEGGLTRRPPARAVSYGPRRVLYPQLGSMRDDAMHLLEGSVLLRDRCLSEEVLRTVEDWAVRRLGAEASPGAGPAIRSGILGT